MEILNRVFNTSITGSILFFIFLFLKPLTKKHFNSSWHYKMLILILTFFIIPVDNFIKLPVNSILNNSNSETGELGISENTNTTIKGKNARNNRITEKKNLEYEVKDNLTNKDITPIKKENQDFQDIKFNINLYKDRIQYIWIIGIVALFLLKIIPYTRFKSFILRDSIIVEENDILELFNICKDELSINNKVRLRTCNTVGSPMLIGILHPMVLLPNMNENDKRLKMIFLHELNHYKRKDIIIKAFGLIINAIHWFNPLIYLLLREMDKYCEYSIDEKVVEEMNINDRKYYGETILSLISNSMLKRSSLTTAMGSSGKQLKARLENMIYSFKTTRKKQITSLFIGILILLSGFTVACSLLPNNTAEENDSFVVYMKEDGLYYSYLDSMAEIKIHEGKEFIYPLISKKGSYIAYTKGKSFYIYDIKNKEYEKIADDIDHYYTSYDWIDDETIVYSTESPGFTIYNASTKIRKEHLDEYHYANLRSDNKNTIYGIKMSKWTTKEGDFAANNGVVEINLKDYDSKNKVFPINTIIKSRETTDEMIGYNPIIWDITEDGKYIYIMEKPNSGSLSTDGIGIGIYDVEKKEHRELTDITLLPYKDNLSINPRNNDLIALIEGPGREMIFYKEVILLDINEDKTFETVNFMDKGFVAMTPSFTVDGEKLLYSATRGQVESRGFDYNKAFEDWEVQPHHIYEYDLKTSEVRKVTEGDGFDFMPISLSKDSILFSRYKGKGYHSLIKLVNGKEQILADNIIIDYELEGLGFGFYGHSNTEKGIDIYLNERKNENNGITPNHPTEDVLSQLEKKEFYIQGENISNADNEVIVEFGKAFVNLFNGAVGKQKKVSFEKYISNKNLQRFTDKMLELTQKQDLQGGNDVNYGLENEFKQGKLQYIEENLYYIELPFQFEGSGMTAKMLITSQNKILKLVDFYFGTKDGVDTFATGHPAERKIRDPKLWENEDWVRDVFIKLKDFVGVTMTIKEGTVSTTGVTVIFKNDSDNQCTYGEYFLLEKKINERWYQLPVTIDGNYAFNDIGYDLTSGDSRELKVDWAWLYGNLDVGEYRIVKDVDYFRNTGDYDKCYLAAEFKLE